MRTRVLSPQRSLAIWLVFRLCTRYNGTKRTAWATRGRASSSESRRGGPHPSLPLRCRCCSLEPQLRRCKATVIATFVKKSAGANRPRSKLVANKWLEQKTTSWTVEKFQVFDLVIGLDFLYDEAVLRAPFFSLPAVLVKMGATHAICFPRWSSVWFDWLVWFLEED